ncbi:MAG: ATP-binding protein [Actinomycetota bacterium]|jgi:serine/threonine-protein kinase RsbW|nr:ATP-binding protein [Actinomycetota bacterium]
MGLRAELRIDSRVGEITRAREWLIGHARTEGFSEKEVYKFGLAMSEACANIIKHAYGGQPGNPIDLRLVINPRSLILAIEDRGEKFDLAGYAPPDLTEPHEGGYGVFIIRSVMDEVDYDTSGQRGTILTLVKRRSKPEPEDSVD